MKEKSHNIVPTEKNKPKPLVDDSDLVFCIKDYLNTGKKITTKFIPKEYTELKKSERSGKIVLIFNDQEHFGFKLCKGKMVLSLYDSEQLSSNLELYYSKTIEGITYYLYNEKKLS